MRLQLTINSALIELDLPGISEEAHQITAALLEADLSDPKIKNREAISKAFLYVLAECPNANASDLWHHVVYRLYCSILPKYRTQDPKQSWVRAGGDALEMVLERLYSPILAPHGIRIRMLIGAVEKGCVVRDGNSNHCWSGQIGYDPSHSHWAKSLEDYRRSAREGKFGRASI